MSPEAKAFPLKIIVINDGSTLSFVVTPPGDPEDAKSALILYTDPFDPDSWPHFEAVCAVLSDDFVDQIGSIMDDIIRESVAQMTEEEIEAANVMARDTMRMHGFDAAEAEKIVEHVDDLRKET